MVRSLQTSVVGTDEAMINIGDMVDGKYRVTRVLGEGGMGTVVEAYRETLDMHVAIKFMRSDMVVASGGVERFLREARALVKLKSQHAVKVHDLGVHGRSPYIVMEHLEGLDMQTVLDKHGPMSASDAARHIRQACEAIAEAHSLGIYHRDLKPANLFLAKGPSGRTIVKVLDFGIAKILRPSDDKRTRCNSLTGANILIGTLPYMSPEQIMAPKDIDGRADIWSLGVVLYELVTGELPFQGRDLYEIQQAIRFEQSLLPALHSSLSTVIRRCLEKDRADRYASAEELALALRPITVESLSPFGSPSMPKQVRPPESIVIRNATASPLPGARLSVDLAVAEGLASSNSALAATVRAMGEPRGDIRVEKVVSPSGPDSGEMETLRIPAKIAACGTVVDTPEPPTLERSRRARPAAVMNTLASASSGAAAVRKKHVMDLQPQIVPVRRGVLVVKQPIQMVRRRRTISRKSRFAFGALMLCAVVFGVDLYRENASESQVSTTASTHK